jgi:hypothetical protein
MEIMRRNGEDEHCNKRSRKAYGIERVSSINGGARYTAKNSG